MKIPYLTYKKLANGEIAYYFNIPARLIPEGCTVKSQPLGKSYLSACQKALKLYRELQLQRSNNDGINPKSFKALWNLYKESRFYKELSDRTKRDYCRCAEQIQNKENKSGQKLGEIPLDIFDSDSAYKLYERFCESFKQKWAQYCIAVLRIVYNFGVRKEILSRKNPFEKLRIKLARPKKIFIPAKHVEILINKASELKLPEVALAVKLNFYICQRPADILKLKKSDLYQKEGNYFFNIIQNKTGANVHVPIPPQLVNEILSCKDWIIANNKGAPYSVNNFGKIFKRVNDACGFNYTFRLLRHSGSTAYAEAGVNTSAIISLTGHTDEKIFNTTYKANSERLSLEALNKRLEAEKKDK